MNIDISMTINMELELQGIFGPFNHYGFGDTVQTKFYIDTVNKTLGGFSGAAVLLTDTTIEVATPGGSHTDPRNTLESLIVQQLLENLQKEAEDSIETDLAGLWTDGYVNVTPEESDLIKTLIIEKSEQLQESA